LNVPYQDLANFEQGSKQYSPLTAPTIGHLVVLENYPTNHLSFVSSSVQMHTTPTLVQAPSKSFNGLNCPSTWGIISRIVDKPFKNITDEQAGTCYLGSLFANACLNSYQVSLLF
jgi:hypothetical protein